MPRDKQDSPGTQLKKQESTALKLLKKRSVAALLSVALVCSSTVLSVQRTLGAECRKVMDTFYDGVYNESRGTTNRSINSQLAKRLDAANWLITVAANYPDLSEKTADLRAGRIILMGTEQYDITQKYRANDDLDQAFYALSAALGEMPLTDREKDMISEYSISFRGAQNLIDSAGYNEAVRAFERSALNVFPANILKDVAGVKPPELFEPAVNPYEIVEHQ